MLAMLPPRSNSGYVVGLFSFFFGNPVRGWPDTVWSNPATDFERHLLRARCFGDLDVHYLHQLLPTRPLRKFDLE